MKQNYRIGQIVPSSNTTMETEIPLMLRGREAIAPERFSFHSSRMRMQEVTKEELEAMDRDSDRCATFDNFRSNAVRMKRAALFVDVHTVRLDANRRNVCAKLGENHRGHFVGCAVGGIDNNVYAVE